MRVREADQGWIYGNYTCRVRNQMGQSDLKIDLHRASKNLCVAQPGYKLRCHLIGVVVVL